MKKFFNLLMCFTIVCLGQLTFALGPREPSANGLYQIEANWTDLKRGWNILTFVVTDANQQPVSRQNIDMVYDMIGMPMSPPNNPVVEKGNGNYEKKIFLGMSGTWKFDMKLKVNNVEDKFTKTQVTR